MARLLARFVEADRFSGFFLKNAPKVLDLFVGEAHGLKHELAAWSGHGGLFRKTVASEPIRMETLETSLMSLRP